ncbi:MAG: glycosyltransferase family 4 protein [Candidatus Cloacimonadaceae bacterium]|nr:glycosyltransferase family 4 protein [Candidatus Cloacimonadaceae bacterium]MDP3114861.1 glycosyltransferase family 4 protein [Candidatus Cloacimonadaceae bacterium]
MNKALPPAIFIKPSRSSFIHIDENILTKRFRLSAIYLAQDISKGVYFWRILLMMIRILISFKTKLVIVWFADYHAAIAVLTARILGKKSLIFVGGYDAVRYPQLGMGVYVNAFRGKCASFALKHCDRVIVNHETLIDSDNFYYNPEGHPEGIKRLVAGLETPVDVVYNAVTTSPPVSINRDRHIHILAVGSTPRYEDLYNKGYDLLIETAKQMHDYQFVIVGIRDCWMPDIEACFHVSSILNLRLMPPLPQTMVFELMRDSMIFAQPSISEGMPNSLMEAMLMGCVPVGSSVAGIPMIIDQYGIVFTKRDALSLQDALNRALVLDAGRDIISKSIATRFSLEKRERALLESVDRLFD